MHKNQPCVLTFSHPHSPQGSVIFSQTKPVLAPSDFPAVLSNEPTLAPSATPTASTGSMVKVSHLSPLSSISKQGTTNARCRKSSRPGSAKIITASLYKTELEKKRGVGFTETSKKLTCPKSLCERHSKQQNGNRKQDPFLVVKVGLSNPW